ncbi:MAG: hypothetical protein Q4D62_06150 [Planctomycetia bacterium]|nr:hypothetical protein [Planctomycetia bacterium]
MKIGLPTLRFYIHAMLLWGMTHPISTAMAQKMEEEPTVIAAKSSVWAIPYILIVLVTGLAVWWLCMPSKRREKAKLED